MSTTKQHIGRYVLLETIGRGAMGVVYRAEDPVIHRTVAVKVLHSVGGLTPAQAGQARERFSREGRALGSIDHPNIIRVFDVGEDHESGEMFIVMEFVPGPTLERVIVEASLELDKAVAIVGQIAAGLDAAHAQGVIHRDIKPSNILMTDDGTAKIADFGITLVESSVLTQDIRELGTPAYMSPEQVSGKALDSKADLFSLGVLTYEMLADRKPFGGADIVAIAYAIAHAHPVPISEANPGLPQALDPVLERILAKEPSDRFASGKEFHDALRACLSDEAAGPSAPPVAVASKRPYVAWGMAAVALVGVAVAVVLLSRQRGTGSPPADSPFPSDPVATISSAAPVRPEAKGLTQQSARAKPLPPPPRTPAKKPPTKPGAPPVAPAASDARVASKAESRPSVPKAATVSNAAATVATAPTVNVTISLAHRLRRGTLIVLLDGVAVFNEKFAKSKLALVQTTVWDPLKAPVGGHTLTARVTGEDGKTYVSDSYTFEFPRDQGVELRFGLKGDSLTVKQRAG